MSIGEAGSLSTNSPTENAPINVTFTDPLTDPVIALTGTNAGGNAYTFRITNIQTNVDGDATGFTFIIEEWEYLDGPHGATEQINWLAIEKGVHTLSDGRIIEAGTTSATDATSSVSFSASFGSTPVVLTSVMSENDTTTVDSDPFSISSSGFSVALQEEEGQDGVHAAETVGYIAIQSGGSTATGTATTDSTFDEVTRSYALGATFLDPVSLGETQTLNGPDPANVVLVSQGTSSASFYLQEEQSNDNETGHALETIGVVTFENGQIFCFTPDALIDTPFGPRPITDLGGGDLVLTMDNGPQAVTTLLQSTLDPNYIAARPDLRPVIVDKDAIAPGMPSRQITLSPQHRVLVTGWRAQLHFGESEVLVPIKALINGTTIRQTSSCDPVTYVHLVFDRHEIVTSAGLRSESLHCGHMAKESLAEPERDELFSIFPKLKTAPNSWGGPARPILTVRQGRSLRSA